MTALETPVQLFQHEHEFAQLLDLYRQRQPNRVLEVGSFHGGSLYHWLRNAQPGSVVVSIDRLDQGVDNSSHYRDWAPEGVSVIALVGDSNDTTTQQAAAKFGPFDWIFIDAGHYDHEVREDWRLYRELAAPGAVVAFHDINPTSDPTIEVDQLWAELADAFDTIEISEPYGFGIGVIYLGGNA